MEFAPFLSHMRIFEPEHYKMSLYDEKLAEAKLADACGFDALWVPEHHLIHYMQAPNGLILSVFYGKEVSIPVGQMVNILAYRHPLLVAGEVALTDVLLDGKFMLGVGKGAYEYEFERLNIPFDKANDQFLESLEVLEKVWSREDEGVTYSGEHFKFENTYVWPRPVQKPHPPIWYAAMTPPSIAFAAERGYHVANWPFLRPMSFVESVAKSFHECREKAGHARGEQKLGVMRPVYVAVFEAEARKSVERMLMNHRLSQRIRSYDMNIDSRAYVTPDPLDDEPSPDEVFENMIAGTREQCLEKLAKYDAIGVDQLLPWFDFGMEHDDVMRSMKLFADEVMEPFRKSRSLSRPGPAKAVKAA
ncbi:MAG TPA: hypothetical protein DEB63_06710 [Agrobacterium sp.]|nr:hypothetical protein [Agrobacterium sp.]